MAYAVYTRRVYGTSWEILMFQRYDTRAPAVFRTEELASLCIACEANWRHAQQFESRELEIWQGPFAEDLPELMCALADAREKVQIRSLTPEERLQAEAAEAARDFPEFHVRRHGHAKD